ncbi:MAG: hypothetical protein ACRCX2_35140 [Paraclostridium sp.]
MDMQKYVTSVLKEVGVPFSFVARDESRLPLIVYNITQERGDAFWDDEEKVTKYGISINIFSNGNFVDIKNKVIVAMRNAGFIRTEISSCIYQEDVRIYNQPIFFDYYYEKREEE